MPFAGYTNFADCVSKNKDKDTPDAYCGYIKHQVEGGKKKEEAMKEEEEHEAFHLEEEVKRMEEEEDEDEVKKELSRRHEEIAKYEEKHGKGSYPWDKCIRDQEKKYGSKERAEKICGSIKARYGEEDDEVKKMEEEIAKMEEEAGMKKDEAAPPLKEAAYDFVTRLTATLDDVHALAAGWESTAGVGDKVSPSPPTEVNGVSGDLVDVVVNRANIGKAQINWFNTVLSEMSDIVKDTDKFMVDAGWNSAEVVKEYNAHKKKWGKDWM